MRCDGWMTGLMAVGIAVVVAGCVSVGSHGRAPAGETRSKRCVFPTVNARHTHMTRLLANAMEYLRPEHGLIEPKSGYPREGWNDDPKTGLRLRGFTQLTAIGAWMELLAQVAGGYADSPYVSRAEALVRLEHLTDSLLADQRDPQLSDRGLLCNFMGFGAKGREAPLASVASKSEFREAFGPVEGEAVWRALSQRGWLKAWQGDEGADIVREGDYGEGGFTGELAVYDRAEMRARILAILDRRVLQIIYGDNANLAASVAKTQGALMDPGVRDTATAGRIREKLEFFIEAQRPGYEYLYDAKRGLFRFGWNASDRRFVGWAVDGGEWQAGYSDYLVNEFRGPTQFVVIRYGMPLDALRNLGFWIKGRITEGGRHVFTLAPWEGSAFQAFGLSLFMRELTVPGWRAVLENAVRINLDYSRQHRLPGFLTESYTGNGIEYTGRAGVPELAVDPKPRVTNAPSLYTVGVAYSILPEEVEQFLGEQWSGISGLFTRHGPWEGVRVDTGERVECQTAAHVMSLILGGIGRGSVAMSRYLDERGFAGDWARVYPWGERVDLLGVEAKAVVWSPGGGGIQGQAVKGAYRLWGAPGKKGAITWTFPGRLGGVSPSDGELRIRYCNNGSAVGATLAFEDRESGSRRVANLIAFRFENTGAAEAELRIPLPATPGLTGIREVVLIGSPDPEKGIDLMLRELCIVPYTVHD